MFRALLLGVSEYSDTRIKSLPFIATDLDELAVTLERAGYQVARACDGATYVGRTTALKALQLFLRSAGDDTVLLFLSGHGVTHEGREYLVPSDADLDVIPLREALVPIDLAPEIERSRAKNVLIFIDACREGFDENTMKVSKWSESKLNAVAGRRVAYVFASGPGQYARFVATATEHYSVFARSLQYVIDSAGGPLSLSHLDHRLRSKMAEIVEQAALGQQTLSLRGEFGSPETLFILPNDAHSSSIQTEGSIENSANSSIWECVRGENGLGPTKAMVARCVQACNETIAQYAARANDPWRQLSLAQRVVHSIEFVLTRLVDKPDLSEPEAALLLTLPHLREALWSKVLEPTQIAELWNDGVFETNLSPEFDRFYENYPRLLRRARRATEAGQKDVARQIGLWVLHRWLRARPESWSVEPLASYIDFLGDLQVSRVLRSPALLALLRSMGSDPEYVSRAVAQKEIEPARVLGGGTRHEVVVREEMIGYILAVAYQMAIDPISLSSTLVEHIGIADPVSIGQIESAITGAHWEPRGTARTLRALCDHPAIEVALRAHATEFDHLLAEVHSRIQDSATLEPLTLLPTRVGSDAVAPVATAEGISYRSAGIRFSLSEERVQEILMGEQLYGDPSLAIRELYQNALDACRYRKARLEFLARERGESVQWKGEVRFTQGTTEDGRSYLECSDNGVGMAMRELRGVFSSAGVRFADMPEFREELAQWSSVTPPIEFTANSQFGVGVLSYFMLADEVQIRTTRMRRDGSTGELLLVTIAGPGTLFRVRSGGHASGPGTTVRLFLNDHLSTSWGNKLSCVDFLTSVLWVAEFATSASDGRNKYTWEPGELSRLAPLEAYDPLRSNASSETFPHVWPSAVKDVWWADSDGRVIADGIWAGPSEFPGAVLNLSGKRKPRLSVDRKNILDIDKLDLKELTREAARAYSVTESSRESFSWLWRVTSSDIVTADSIFRRLLDSDRKELPLPKQARELLGVSFASIEAVGCDPADDDILRALAQSVPVRSIYHRSLPDDARFLERWSLASPVVADLYSSLKPSKVSPARPKDRRLLELVARRSSNPMSKVTIVDIAVQLEETLTSVLARVADLRPDILLPDFGAMTPRLESNDARYLAKFPSRDVRPGFNEEATFADVMRGSIELGLEPLKVAARYCELGFRLNFDLTNLGRQPTAGDLPLFLTNIWTQDGIAHDELLLACGHCSMPPYDLVAKLAEFGATVDPLGYSSEVPEESSLAELRQLQGTSYGALRARSLNPAFLLELRSRLSADRAAACREVLEQLGYDLPSWLLLSEIREDDVALLRRSPQAHYGWLNSAAVSHVRVLTVSATDGRSPADIASRYRELGFSVDVDLFDCPAPTAEDLALIEACSSGWRLDLSSTVPLGGVKKAARSAGISVTEVASRLARYGLQVPPTDVDALSAVDGRLLDVMPYGGAWLSSGEIVPVEHVIRVAQVLGTSMREVESQLARLGFVVESAPALESIGTARRAGQSVDAIELVLLAFALGKRIGHVAEAMLKLGLDAAHEPIARELLPDLSTVDLLSIGGDLTGPWPRTDRVTRLHLAAVAARRRMEPIDVYESLRGYGINVCGPPLYSLNDLLLRFEPIVQMLSSETPQSLDGDEISTIELWSLAGDLSVPPSDLAETLSALGYTLQMGVAPLGRSLTPFENDVVSVLRSRPPLRIRDVPGSPADPGTVYAIWRRLDDRDISPRSVAEALAQLGLSVNPEGFLPSWPSDQVQRLLFARFDNGFYEDGGRLGASTVGRTSVCLADLGRISVGAILGLSRALEMSPGDVAELLAEMGPECPSVESIEEFAQILVRPRWYDGESRRDYPLEVWNLNEVIRFCREFQLDVWAFMRSLSRWNFRLEF